MKHRNIFSFYPCTADKNVIIFIYNKLYPNFLFSLHNKVKSFPGEGEVYRTLPRLPEW